MDNPSVRSHGDSDDIAPGDAAVEKREVGVDARKRKEERDEEGREGILNLLGDLDGKAPLVGAHEPDHEGPENGVDANDAGEEGESGMRGEGVKEAQIDPCLAHVKDRQRERERERGEKKGREITIISRSYSLIHLDRYLG